MLLTPVASTASSAVQASKTWKIDFDKKRIEETIDGLDALRQAVFLHLNSERYEHVIFSRDYGVETKNLQGKSYDLARKELQAAIEDALSVDNRITGVSDFTFSRSGDSMTVSFKVASSDGSVIVEADYNV